MPDGRRGADLDMITSPPEAGDDLPAFEDERGLLGGGAGAGAGGHDDEEGREPYFLRSAGGEYQSFFLLEK